MGLGPEFRVEGDGVVEGGEEGVEEAEVVGEGGAFAVDVGVGGREVVGWGGGHCGGSRVLVVFIGARYWVVGARVLELYCMVEIESECC